MSRARVGTEGDERGVVLTARTDNGFSDIGPEELAARNKEVARENFRAAALDTLIGTRARQLADEPPPPDLQVAQEAIRSARTRLSWAQGTASKQSATAPT
jgi:hypothetical protein